MPDEERIDTKRREFLTKATAAVGAVGLAAAAIPFGASLLPSKDAEEAGKPIRVNIAAMKPGDQLTVNWRGRPVWIIKRTPEALNSLSIVEDDLRDPYSDIEQQPDYARNQHRSIRPDILVLVGVCTHLGCAPTYRPDVGGIDQDWQGGFFCSCHGSRFDLAGRVYKGVPAPINMEVPPYAFLSDDELIIGTDDTSEVV